MSLKQMRAAALKAAQDIITKAQGENRPMTDDERAQVQAKRDEIVQLDAKIRQADEDDELLKSLTGPTGAGDDPADQAPATSAYDAPGDGPDSSALGDQFVKSGAYQSWAKANPAGLGSGSPVRIDGVKAGSFRATTAGGRKEAVLGTPAAHIAPVRFPTVDLVSRPALTLLDLISHGRTAGNFEYLQIQSVTRNAQVVPEVTTDDDPNGLKPISTLETSLEDAKVATYADGAVIHNSLLADAPALATFLNQELTYNLNAEVENLLLNGTGTNGQPKGILNTTGVQEQEYTAAADDPMPMIKAIRRAITKVVRLEGGTVTGVLINPEDEENIDLMQDADRRFYGGGPFAMGPATLWGRPRVISERIPVGQFLLGNFSTIALLEREAVKVEAFNQHKDYAQRNLVYVRAELRAAQATWKPAHLVHGGPAAG